MKPSTKSLGLVALGLLLVGWITYLAAGRPLAEFAASLAGERLVRLADGKFDDPATFLHGRLGELLLILSTLAALILAARFVHRLLARHCSGAVHTLLGGALAFAGINLLLAVCGSTVLCWMALYSPVHIDNFVQYHIKRGLLDETGDKPRALMLGNSQTNRCIDEIVLNRELGEQLWTTDLTQPGARGFDLLVLGRDVPIREGDRILCYLSEIMFHGAGSGIVVSDFLHFGDLADLHELDGWGEMERGSVRSGLLGRALPCHRYGEALSRRILGGELLGLRQARHDQAQETDLESQADRRFPSLKIDHGSRFQQQAFARMVREAVAAGAEIVIIDGYVHPALEARLDGPIHADMQRFLRELENEHPDKLRILDGARLLAPAEESFSDLVHFTPEAQQRFSQALAQHLRRSEGF